MLMQIVRNTQQATAVCQACTAIMQHYFAFVQSCMLTVSQQGACLHTGILADTLESPAQGRAAGLH